MTANRISTTSLVPNTFDHRRESKQSKSILRLNENQNARKQSISRSQANFTPPLYPQKPLYQQQSIHQRKNSGGYEQTDCSPSYILSHSPDQSYISASQIHMNYNNAKYYMFDTRRPSEIQEDRVLVSSTALQQQINRPSELEPHPADTLKSEETKDDKTGKQFISDRLSTSQMSRRNLSGQPQCKLAEREKVHLSQRIQELEQTLRQRERQIREKEDEVARMNNECQRLHRELKHSKSELVGVDNSQEESRNLQKKKDECIGRLETELHQRSKQLRERGSIQESLIQQNNQLTKENEEVTDHLQNLLKQLERIKRDRHTSTPLSPSLKSTNLQIIHSNHTGRRLPRSYSQQQYGRNYRPLTPHSHYKGKSPSVLSYQENQASKERREAEMRSEKDVAHNELLVLDLKRLLSVQHRNEVFKKVKQLLTVNRSTSKSISLFQRLKKLMNDCYNDEPPLSGHQPGTRTGTFFKEDQEFRNRSSQKYSKSHHKRTGTISREFSHKDVWRWIRKIMTEYSALKTEETECKGSREKYWKDQIDLLVEITRCPDYNYLISTVEKLNEEHHRMSAMMRKMKQVMRLRKYLITLALTAKLNEVEDALKNY